MIRMCLSGTFGDNAVNLSGSWTLQFFFPVVWGNDDSSLVQSICMSLTTAGGVWRSVDLLRIRFTIYLTDDCIFTGEQFAEWKAFMYSFLFELVWWQYPLKWISFMISVLQLQWTLKQLEEPKLRASNALVWWKKDSWHEGVFCTVFSRVFAWHDCLKTTFWVTRLYRHRVNRTTKWNAETYGSQV